jgi:hypothetical protein
MFSTNCLSVSYSGGPNRVTLLRGLIVILAALIVCGWYCLITEIQFILVVNNLSRLSSVRTPKVEQESTFEGTQYAVGVLENRVHGATGADKRNLF